MRAVDIPVMPSTTDAARPYSSSLEELVDYAHRRHANERPRSKLRGITKVSSP